MAGPHVKMVIPLKGKGGALPEYKGNGQPYVPGQTAPALQAADMGGAGAAAAAKMAGQNAQALAGLAKAGDMLVQKGLNIYESYQSAKAQEAFNQYELEEMKLRAELAELKGSNALGEEGVEARFSRWRNEARERLGGNLGPIAREMFTRQAQKIDARSDVWAAGKTARELRVFQDSVSEGSVSNAIGHVLANPGDNEAMARALGIMKAEYERTGARNGWDGEYTRAKILDAARGLEEKRIGQLVDSGRLEEAKALAGGGGSIAEDLHNPLNLKKVGATGHDRSAFENFATDADGFRAAWRQLRRYNTHRGLKTVESMVRTWAPASDGNNHETYFKNMRNAGLEGVGLDGKKETPVDIHDPAQAAKMISAMAIAEGPLGKKYNAADIEGFLRETQEIKRSTATAATSLLPPGSRGKWLKRIEAAEKQEHANLRAELTGQIQDQMAMFADGKIPENKIDRQELVKAFGEDAPELIDRLDFGEKYATFLSQMRNMTPEQQEETLKELTPKEGSGYREKGIMFEAAQKARDADMRARAMDPTAYLLARNGALRESYANMLQHNTRENTQAYLTALRASSDFLGLGDVPIFPQGQAQILADTIMQAPEPVSILKNMGASFGPEWPKAMKELSAKNCLPVLTQFALDMPAPAANLLLTAAKEKDFMKNSWELHKESFTKDDFKSAVRKNTSEFNSTLLAGGSSEVATEINNAVAMLALQYVNKGIGYESAIEKAANEVFAERYSIKSVNGVNFRVPKAFDGEAIEHGAAAALEKIAERPADLDIREYRKHGEYAARMYGDVIRGLGHWVINGDESGLILFKGDNAVRDKNGEVIVRTWDQLMDAAKDWLEREERIQAALDEHMGEN